MYDRARETARSNATMRQTGKCKLETTDRMKYRGREEYREEGKSEEVTARGNTDEQGGAMIQ